MPGLGRGHAGPFRRPEINQSGGCFCEAGCQASGHMKLEMARSLAFDLGNRKFFPDSAGVRRDGFAHRVCASKWGCGCSDCMC